MPPEDRAQELSAEAAARETAALAAEVATLRRLRARALARGETFGPRLDARLLVFAGELRARQDKQKRLARKQALRAIKKD